MESHSKRQGTDGMIRGDRKDSNRMEIYLLRHGETDWNREKRFQGQINTSLNMAGFRQAQQCHKMVERLGLSFDRVYSSPLCRAMETTETVSLLSGDRIIKDPRLMEMDFGAIDGTPFDRDSAAAGLLFKDPDRYVPQGGGETFPQLLSRLQSFYEDLKKTEDKSVLIGSHGCAIRCMLVSFGYLKLSEIWQMHIPNCTIIHVELRKDGTFCVKNFYEIGKS